MQSIPEKERIIEFHSPVFWSMYLDPRPLLYLAVYLDPRPRQALPATPSPARGRSLLGSTPPCICLCTWIHAPSVDFIDLHPLASEGERLRPLGLAVY